jgi:hypothetical protein
VVAKRNPFLTLAFIGIGGLVAGTGRLVQAYREHGSLVPIPVLVISAGFGLVITILTIRALAQIFLDDHPSLKAGQLWLVLLAAILLLALAFVAGAASSG